jgi:serine/threonine protein kinase/tetratricopeptide (TPR) repeat protein
MDAIAVDILSKRYELAERIGAGGMGEVFLSSDLLTNQPVAVKRVYVNPPAKPGTGRATDATRLLLTQEFSVLASMRHPNIISVLDYGFDPKGGPFFVMEYLPRADTVLEASRSLPLDGKVSLVIQMLQALTYLHRRGLIHRDLKPANVLVVQGADGEPQVKLLDFGLASTAKEAPEEGGGTLAYMAPEAFMDEPLSAATDLFSLGVMAFEMIGGVHPFEELAATGSQLVISILHGEPNYAHLDVPPALKDVIATLLEKDPADRYSSAEAVIAAMCSATGIGAPPETEAIRESFLQAAQFVNRQSEMTELNDVLKASASGNGAIWLVGGESGIGKSRLIDELRIRALVGGSLVIRSQSVTEQSSPYTVWRPVLRRLVIHSDLSDLEAGVLKELVPDIDTLLKRTISDPPAIEPAAAQTRLLQTIESLLARQTQPLVILFEDLQWENIESLRVLTYLARVIESMSVLIIGSYRSDERPDLPDDVPGARSMRVGRLEEPYIKELSVSILGERGDDERIVQLLQEETEGNAFFLVEIVRTLAEEAGTLSGISSLAELPENVITGGIRRTMERRIGALPDAAYPLLHAAAIAGRRIDLEVLPSLESPMPYQQWLIVCADAAIIDVQDNEWRFAHDKLREFILDQIPPDQKVRFHQQVAQALERTYPDTPETYAVLAYHWGQGENPAKEGYYAARAGQQAFSSSAYQQAIAQLTRALELKDDAGFTTEEQADFERIVGESYFGIGRLTESTLHLKRAVKLLGYTWPTSLPGMLAHLNRVTARQFLHRVMPGTRTSKSSIKRLASGSLAFERISHAYYFENENFPTLYAALSALNLAEQAGPSPEVVRGLATLHIVAGIVPMHGLARYYGKLAYETAEKIENASASGWIDHVSGVYHSGIGELDKGAALLEGAMEVWTKLGDTRRWQESLTLWGMTEFARGNLERSEQMRRELFESAVKTDSDQAKVWGPLGLAEIALRRGQFHEAYQHIEEAQKSPEGIRLVEKIWLHGMLALALLSMDEAEDAKEHALESLKLSLGSSPNGYYALEGYSGAAEVLLELWKQNPTGENWRNAQRGLRSMKKFGSVFPIGEARALTWAGWAKALKGDHVGAKALWEKALLSAETYHVPYERGLISYHGAVSLPVGDADRGRMLAEAKGAFQVMGTPYLLGLVEKAEKGVGA